MELTNSTLPGNTADGHGGGISTNGLIDLNNVTITNNTADNDNDGVGDDGGIARFGTVRLRNTLLAGNTDRGGQAPDCSGELTSEGFNLIQDTTGCTIAGDATGNITGQDPNLGLLADNGGHTLTHALLPGSQPVLVPVTLHATGHRLYLPMLMR
ncbi:MAG: choice-of-anchor Q domain-containing protein [Anaerolineae bacterium]